MGQNNQPRVFTRGGGTFEMITWVTTAIGILLPTFAILALRGFIVFGACVILAMIGRDAGAVLLGCAAAIRHWWKRQWDGKAGLIMSIVIVAGIVMFGVAAGGYWPPLVTWGWFNHQMYVGYFGQAMHPAQWYHVLARLLCVFVVPFIVWNPARWFSWAWEIELKWPGAREVRMSPADIRSVQAHEWGLTSKKQQQRPQRPVAPVSLPSPTVKGE